MEEMMKVVEMESADSRTAGLLKYKALLQIVLASLFIGISAQIKIPLPFTPIPFTGQTFAVMLLGALLGPRKGTLAVLLYLVQGSLGCPVWAGGQAGFHHLMGPTGGYRFGHLLEAYLIGWLLQKQTTRHISRIVGAILLPCLVQLGIGTLWLSIVSGVENALALGFYPFIPIEIGKAFLAAYCLKVYEK
jgi:biotin transport system substrate-specific component